MISGRPIDPPVSVEIQDETENEAKEDFMCFSIRTEPKWTILLLLIYLVQMIFWPHSFSWSC